MPLFLVILFFVLVSPSHATQETISSKTVVPTACQKQLVHTSLTIDTHQLDVRIAADPASREQGLMRETSLPANTGMLFVFPTSRHATFWMKDTPLPLSIAYLNATGRILEIHDLEPFSERAVPSSSSSVVYALEVPRGWFANHQVLPGDYVNGLPSNKTAQ